MAVICSGAMRVYLVRHGKAVDAGYARDEDRPLTDEGRQRMRRNVKAWKARGEPSPELWLCSPLVRAVQTAELCLAGFGADGPLEITRDLVPEGRISAAADLCTGNVVDAVALVSHEPLMSALGAHLLGLRSFPIAFKKGAVLAIDIEDGLPGKLAWHLMPAGEDREARFLEVL